MGKRRKPLQVLRIVLILIGVLGIVDTMIVSTISHPNLGVLLPAILGAPLLLLGIFLPALSSGLPAGAYSAVRWVFLVGYGLAFLLFAGTWILIDSTAYRQVPQDIEVVVVLGAGLRNETPMRVLRQRLDRAIVYMEQHPDVVAILSGGQGDGETISEAEAMARYMKAHGMAEERYILEANSGSTNENFAFSYEIIQKRWDDTKKIGFVTTDFHVYRAGRVAEKQGLEAYGIAAQDVWYISLNNHLRECVAIWGYLLTGRI